MFFSSNDNSIRYTGRWKKYDDMTVTTAPGGMIEIAFEGKMAVLHFDIETNRIPYGHLWISVDGGAKTESAIDRYIRICAENDSLHIIKIVYKSSSEIHHRWYQPLEGKVSFLGYDAEKDGILPDDNRKTIEFIGDSITEGVLIDAMYAPNPYDQWNRPYQDDVTATYAYLTAEKLNLKPIIMGYGAVGMTRIGCGSVPKAYDSYPYYFANEPMESANADYILINHGANDRGSKEEEYITEYERFLKLVRARNKNSKIIVLSAFCGAHAEALGRLVEKYNSENDDSVLFIDSTGWVPIEPLHPLRDGHRIISEKLTEILKKEIIAD